MQDAPSSDAASFENVVAARHSVRGYLDKRVPDDVLRHILEVAQRSPSNCNVQPWHVYIASGGSLDRIRARFSEKIQSDAPASPDYVEAQPFAGKYRERQIDCAVALFKSMDIREEDRDARRAASMRNYEFFDAPYIAYIGMPKEYGPILMLDVGMYAQTLMLTMTAHGLASCPQTSICDYLDVIRDEFGLTDDIALVMGLSFGYEDASMPANDARTAREELDEVVVFKD